jgi:hypothetical protein
MEEILRANPETKAELGEMKKLIERYKVTRPYFNQSKDILLFTFPAPAR